MSITEYIYKIPQYYQQLSDFSGANYHPPSPALHLTQSGFGILIPLETE